MLLLIGLIMLLTLVFYTLIRIEIEYNKQKKWSEKMISLQENKNES